MYFNYSRSISVVMLLSRPVKDAESSVDKDWNSLAPELAIQVDRKRAGHMAMIWSDHYCNRAMHF